MTDSSTEASKDQDENRHLHYTSQNHPYELCYNKTISQEVEYPMSSTMNETYTDSDLNISKFKMKVVV